MSFLTTGKIDCPNNDSYKEFGGARALSLTDESGVILHYSRYFYKGHCTIIDTTTKTCKWEKMKQKLNYASEVSVMMDLPKTDV